MITKIILTHEGTLTSQEIEDLRFLFADALSDFRNARINNYIERRYSTMDEVFKERKRQNVRRRMALADKLHNAALHITVETREEDEETHG